MDYFKVEEFRKETNKGIIRNIVGSLGVVVFIYVMVIMLAASLLTDTGFESTVKIITIVSAVIALGVATISVWVYKYSNRNGYGEHDDSRLKKLEARKKKNKIMRDFDRSAKYRQYVGTTNIDNVEEFIKEMANIRDNIEGFNKYMDELNKERFYETYIRVVVEPNYYDKYREVLSKGISYNDEFKEYEELKEESKKEKYRLGAEGIELREELNRIESSVKSFRRSYYVAIIKELSLEDIDYFINKVNGI